MMKIKKKKSNYWEGVEESHSAMNCQGYKISSAPLYQLNWKRKPYWTLCVFYSLLLMPQCQLWYPRIQLVRDAFRVRNEYPLPISWLIPGLLLKVSNHPHHPSPLPSACWTDKHRAQMERDGQVTNNEPIIGDISVELTFTVVFLSVCWLTFSRISIKPESEIWQKTKSSNHTAGMWKMINIINASSIRSTFSYLSS